MARPIDAEKHEARRLHIIDAALTTFAQYGYQGASTAAICRQAQISSGTFFHYFPKKLDVLLAILKLGVGETEEFGQQLQSLSDPLEAIEKIFNRVITDAQDERVPGFLQAVAGTLTIPEVAEVLSADDRAQRELLATWVRRAVQRGQVRTDISAERIASWLQIFSDGFLERAATDSDFSAKKEAGLLLQTVHQFLAIDHAPDAS